MERVINITQDIEKIELIDQHGNKLGEIDIDKYDETTSNFGIGDIVKIRIDDKFNTTGEITTIYSNDQYLVWVKGIGDILAYGTAFELVEKSKINIKFKLNDWVRMKKYIDPVKIGTHGIIVAVFPFYLAGSILYTQYKIRFPMQDIYCIVNELDIELASFSHNSSNNYSLEELEAIKDSIAHWRENRRIIKVWKNMDAVYCIMEMHGVIQLRTDLGPNIPTLIFFNSKHCALCTYYSRLREISRNNICSKCANCGLTKIGQQCNADGSYWYNITKSNNCEDLLKNIDGLINTLEGLL